MKYTPIVFTIFSLHFSQSIEWEKIEEIPEGYYYVIDTNSNGDVIAGGFELNSDYAMQIYYKQNNQDWIEIPGNEQVTIMSGDVLITNTQNIYVCDFAMGLYRTNDLGSSWTGLAELTNEGCSAFNIHESGAFFVGMTYTGIGFIHRSLDSGLSWEAIPLPDYNSNYPVEHIEFDSEGYIYLGTINGIYKSIDNGENWQKVNNGISGEHVSSMFIDENDNMYIYTTYSAQTDGMYYSIDNAESWVSLPIPDYYVVDIVVQDDIIMIIDGYNNIQLTENLGNTWYISNEGLNDNSLYSLHLIQNNTVYAGGRYIHKSNSSIDECIDLAGISFPECGTVIGFGYIDGECQTMYCSSIDGYGVDWSNWIYDTIEECESICIDEYPILGDINNDSQVNVLDIILLVSFILQIDTPTDTEFMAADFNGDGAINVLDVVGIVDLILNSQPPDFTVTDIDGNTYEIVQIGNQLWMAENLKVTHYQNGDEIPYSYNDPQYGAYAEYNNDASNVTVYGRLYNWFALNDERGLCPVNWHVPSDDEFKSLEMYLGMSESEANGEGLRGTDEGGKLKEEGNEHWNSPNTGATNETGFTALPGGNRRYETYTNQEIFCCLNRYGFFWSSSEVYTVNAWYRVLSYDYSESNRYHLSKTNAFSVRCVED